MYFHAVHARGPSAQPRFNSTWVPSASTFPTMHAMHHNIPNALAETTHNPPYVAARTTEKLPSIRLVYNVAIVMEVYNVEETATTSLLACENPSSFAHPDSPNSKPLEDERPSH